MYNVDFGKRLRSTEGCTGYQRETITGYQGAPGDECRVFSNSDELKESPLRMVQKTVDIYPTLFKDNSVSVGGYVKSRGQVIHRYSLSSRRPPNMNCRVELFGRICQKFDERRTRWVCEMGFGGLLQFASHMHLPRQLAYWLMTRIDPINKFFIGTDGRVFPFSKNQVRWILGIPCGTKQVPSNKQMSNEVRGRVQNFLLKYGRSWETTPATQCGRTYTSVGIPVTVEMMDKLEGHFEEEQEEEFKTLFLIIALQMVLCPTQSPRLAHDLLPAISCAMDCAQYDWCELVLTKLMDNVSSFARRFYANGFAGGCGGCAIFVVIFYLDRLDLEPLRWGTFPRVKAWDMKQIGSAAKLDRCISRDYGKLGLVDVAYGERHPRQARDSSGPPDSPMYNDVSKLVGCIRDRRRRADLGAQRIAHRASQKIDVDVELFN